MDFGGVPGFPGGNVGSAAPEIAGGGGGSFDNWAPGGDDHAVWSNEDDYRNWNAGSSSETPSNSSYSVGPLGRPGIEPPNKKSRSSQSGDSSNSWSKTAGRIFFKTKMCSKFRAGVCPYITNCNFAHGMEELRRPPPYWQGIVEAHEDEHGISVEQREEHQIPTISSSELRGESQRSYKGRHCKKFYTDEGCPYGDNCTFLHDEQSRARESVTISVNPIVTGGGHGVACANPKPSNWKMRICNKWEMTGNCPFGSKCHFAHGLAELHKYGGRLIEAEGRDSAALTESKQSGSLTAKTDTVIASPLSAPRADSHHMGSVVPLQRPSGMTHQPGQRPVQKWKGPDKISRIYGDWIDDIE
ncbi:hypothetical protein Nepgr_021526 [Nepenthes gracilis]|uniref:C3H1-type domain-containing protein n=1 Tax=Nepenthes gracilis TaxID=150966 RepID=A0AAD3SXM1_NEPGR|nr:hypothetical protein Nepgr_021526 [Nepenthes gracilis]